MNNCSAKQLRLLPILIASLIFIAIGFSSNVQAATPTHGTSSANPMQLAYFYVYDSYPGRYWGPWRHGRWGPRYYRPHNLYWTGWHTYYYRHGHRCQKSCLINSWNGFIIRCVKRCI
ncbi:hypothetical protein [Legionella brunensis]|uniref:Uncharacterized protein n=1 Tax=Legionella brunensis TaxID=29422 RepID=A0A0W0STR5_9GAMM|nr:hypothetical protein [Legionella brunensis]KTC86605.1 hypothetical protein Lbru_0546 [Legionella brunensis]